MNYETSDESLAQTAFERVLGDAWRFVKEIENGYTMSVYDYDNDLSLRNILEEVVGRLHRSRVLVAREELARLDESFSSLTQNIDGLDLGIGPWKDRVPKKLEQILARDLNDM